ncbi:MAG: hypothetical protein Greene041679_146 [Parcubacteria group bacterium Greene0416_79]|nr:MAG: hypothetical protein Greene041679_146 [Parcubacteria group bacterium Greene0416_79]
MEEFVFIRFISTIGRLVPVIIMRGKFIVLQNIFCLPASRAARRSPRKSDKR